MRKALVMGCALVMMLAWTLRAEEVARPERGTVIMPASWKAVSAQERLMAKRVAEVDAQRLLVERIYGIRLAADTYVLDLVKASDHVKGAVDGYIRGVTTEEVKYTDDMTVEVVRKVTVRDVIETITTAISRTEGVHGVTEKTLESVSRETRDTVLEVMGNSAIPGTRGEKMVQAKRAAEMDAFRQLAEIVGGVQLTSNTKICNLALAYDEIATHMALALRGAKTTKIVYNDDGSCDVTKSVILREIIETVEASYNLNVHDGKISEEAWRNVAVEAKDKVITATGSGVAKPGGAESVGSSEPFSTEVTIIHQVVTREVGTL